MLAVGAHPDDAVLGAGATLAAFARAGYEVTLLSITSGELAGLAEMREEEEREAATRLNASARFGRLADGGVSVRDAIGVISDHVSRIRPTLVFAHDPSDTHQDHVQVGSAALVACRSVPNLLFYEGPSSVRFEPTCVSNATSTWDRKMHALAAYQTQIQTRELLAWVTAVSQYRGWPRHIGAHCEGFRIAHSDLAIEAGTFRMVSSPLDRAFAFET